MDITFLYGQMAGSWLVHMAIPLVVGAGVGLLQGNTLSQQAWLLLGITVFVSFLVQAGFLTFLQASACTGVKDYVGVAKGAISAAVITAVMVAIPLFMEWPRLLVSQLFTDHKTLLTPAGAQMDAVIRQAGQSFAAVQTGGALTPVEYEAQSFREMTYGAAYWAAFAGAYGIGLGSLSASKCPAKK